MRLPARLLVQANRLGTSASVVRAEATPHSDLGLLEAYARGTRPAVDRLFARAPERGPRLLSPSTFKTVPGMAPVTPRPIAGRARRRSSSPASLLHEVKLERAPDGERPPRALAPA